MNKKCIHRNQAMSKSDKYGYCALSQKWMPRDEMLSVNVKFYDKHNTEQSLPLRVSPEAYAQLQHLLQQFAWDNNLKRAEELQAADLEETDHVVDMTMNFGESQTAVGQRQGKPWYKWMLQNIDKLR